MDLSGIKDVLGPHLELFREHIYLCPEFGMLHGAPEPFRFIMQQEPPFIINDHRFGIVVRGEGDINFNLVDHHISAPALVYLGPGTIISPLRFSEDLEIYGIGLFAVSVMTWKSLASDSSLLFPCPLPLANGRRPSTDKCAISNYR